MKFHLVFAWYDFWIGLFYDRAKHRLYVFPIPCVGIMVELPHGNTPNL